MFPAASCARPDRQEQAPDAVSAPSAGVKPRFILEPGREPIWFELGEEGPLWIAGPGEASLAEFRPWPLARYVAGMLVRGNRLSLGVNREGFLILVFPEDAGPDTAPAGDGALSVRLYRAAEPYWDSYTVAALLEYRGDTAALLYRDDFFIDSGAVLPEKRVWRTVAGELRLLPVELPVFAPFPAREGWDLDLLRLGKDGFWYYRGIRKNLNPPEISYFRTKDLDILGEPSTSGVFRNATVPYTIEDAPFPLDRILEKARAQYGGTTVAAASSPDG
jgi:hypothetical protein